MAELGHIIQGVDFLGSPPLKTPGFPMQGWRVSSLAGALRVQGASRGGWAWPVDWSSPAGTDPASRAAASQRQGRRGRGKDKRASSTISIQGPSRVIKHLHMSVVTQPLHNENSCLVLALKGQSGETNN